MTSVYKPQNEVCDTPKWSYEVSDIHVSASDHWSDSTDHWSNHLITVRMYNFSVEMTSVLLADLEVAMTKLTSGQQP